MGVKGGGVGGAQPSSVSDNMHRHHTGHVGHVGPARKDNPAVVASLLLASCWRAQQTCTQMPNKNTQTQIHVPN